jgi:hypothetical protein
LPLSFFLSLQTWDLVFFGTTIASVPSCYKGPSASGPSTTHRHSYWILLGAFTDCHKYDASGS